MNTIRNIILGLFIVVQISVAFEIDKFPNNPSVLEMLSTNCLQMTQSQQMLKAYVMIGLNSNFQNPKRSLSRGIPIYDKRMHQVREFFHTKLGSNHSNEQYKKAFDEALKLWNINKLLLLMPPTAKNAVVIKKNFRIMIKQLAKGITPFKNKKVTLMSITAKLCRKPFEITIDYLMRFWNVDMPNYEINTKKIIDSFYQNHELLLADKSNTKKSIRLLNKSKRGFIFFKFMYNSQLRFIPSLLSRKADDNFKIILKFKHVLKKRTTLLYNK